MAPKHSRDPKDGMKRVNAQNAGDDTNTGNAANREHTKDRGGATPPNDRAQHSEASNPGDNAFLRALTDYRASLKRGRAPYLRQGGDRVRGTSPAWDLTSYRVRRTSMARAERYRSLLSLNGRVPPHWQVFDLLLDAAMDALPKELKPFMDEPEND